VEKKRDGEGVVPLDYSNTTEIPAGAAAVNSVQYVVLRCKVVSSRRLKKRQSVSYVLWAHVDINITTLSGVTAFS